jgi:hypothetical protein
MEMSARRRQETAGNSLAPRQRPTEKLIRLVLPINAIVAWQTPSFWNQIRSVNEPTVSRSILRNIIVLERHYLRQSLVLELRTSHKTSNEIGRHPKTEIGPVYCLGAAAAKCA